MSGATEFVEQSILFAFMLSSCCLDPIVKASNGLSMQVAARTYHPVGRKTHSAQGWKQGNQMAFGQFGHGESGCLEGDAGTVPGHLQ